MLNITETINNSGEAYALYFEIKNVEFSCNKLAIIKNSSVLMKVQFLDYFPFDVQQEEVVKCSEQLYDFKSYQCFNLKHPGVECLSRPKLQIGVYKVLQNYVDCEKVFNISIPFSECERKNLQDFFNKCKISFNISGRYKLTDNESEFSGFMTILLRLTQFHKCENVESPIVKYSDISKLKSCLRNECSKFSLNEGIGTNHCHFNETGAEKLNDPEFRNSIYKKYTDDPFLDDEAAFIPDTSSQYTTTKSLCSEYQRLHKQASKENTDKLNTCSCKSSEQITGEPKAVKKKPASASILKSPNQGIPGESSLTVKLSKFGEKTGALQTPKKKRKNKGANGAQRDANYSRTADKRVREFVYSMGDFYPGFGRAHKYCVDQDTKVPGRMGWMWNLSGQFVRPRRGWRPGTLSAYMREIVRREKAKFVSEHQPKSSRRRKKTHLARPKSLTSVSKLPRQKSQVRRKIAEEEKEVEIPPTLCVSRKEGKYHISMYPVGKEAKAPRLMAPPKPMQFTIERDKDDASSAASDMEIEYSVPIAASKYRKKPDVVHVDTQVRQAEIISATTKTATARKKSKK